MTVVLPSEYDIDPTGVGKALGLAEMGEIKMQLHDESDHLLLQNDPQSSLGDAIFGLFVGAAHAQSAEV